jgi:predicted DNA-binding WGR domain protein
MTNSNQSFPLDSNFALDRRRGPVGRFGMSDLPETGSSALQIVLQRVDPSKNMARYYVLSIQPTLFANNTLIRHWGRTGSVGRERTEFFDDHIDAAITLETWLARKLSRGYVVRP